MVGLRGRSPEMVGSWVWVKGDGFRNGEVKGVVGSRRQGSRCGGVKGVGSSG